MQIMPVEADGQLADGKVRALMRVGFAVTWQRNRRAAIDSMVVEAPEVLVLVTVCPT